MKNIETAVKTILRTIPKAIKFVKNFPVVIEDDNGIKVVAATKAAAVEKYLEAIKASK